MSIAERRQRERAAREELILAEGRRMVLESGYLGLNMDRLARAIDYSKGTIYQHFTTKEDLLLGIVTEGKLVRADLFRRAGSFDGRPREKMAAIGVADRLFALLHPEHFQVEHLVRLDSVWDKTGPERRARLEAADTCCSDACRAIIRDAIASGDLALEEEEAWGMFFLLMAASLGTHLLASDPGRLAHHGFDDPDRHMRRNYDRYLDAWGWKPLSTDQDSAETYRRIGEELFREEYRRLDAASPSGAAGTGAP